MEKCLFYQTEMEFLGFIATTDGLKMDPKKVEAIVSVEVFEDGQRHTMFSWIC